MQFASLIAAGLVVAAACESRSPPPAPAPKGETGAGAPARDATPFGDVRRLTDRVFAVGKPALRLGGELGPGFTVTRAFVFAQHDWQVGIWDTKDGGLVRSFDADLGHAVSSDGLTIAVKPDSGTYLYHPPFEEGEKISECHGAYALSHDGRLIACPSLGLAIWDVSTRKKLAELEFKAESSAIGPYRLLADKGMLAWASEDAVWRWDFTSSTTAVRVYRAPSRILHERFMANGAAVVLDFERSSAQSSVRVDLATGQVSSLSIPQVYALSPSGKLMASLDEHAVRVHDIASGAVLWSAPITDEGVGDVVFGEDDHLLAYINNGVIHIVDLPGGPRSYPAPSRFVGWLAEGVAAIERSGQHATITLPAGTIGSASSRSPVVAPKPTWQLTPKRLLVGGKTITAGRRAIWIRKPEWQPELWGAALAPDGKTVAVVVRRTDLGAADELLPGEDAKHLMDSESDARLTCRTGMTLDCVKEYFAQLWSLSGTPKQLWQRRLNRTHGYTSLNDVATASGPVVIDRAGKRVLVGTTDGDIQIVSGPGEKDSKVMTLHHSPITRLELSPGGGWVMSEDASGEQRLWALPPLPPAAGS